jgi:hypothetical protein
MAAVRQRGWALANVPENLKTDEICMAAIRQDKSALMWVPKN